MAHDSEIISADQAFINKLKEIIESNITNEQFGVEELAEEIGLSRSQVHRKLKLIANKSVSQFIREYRLEKAMIFLRSEIGTASEIAYKVGFNSPSYFNKCFQEFYGFSPGEVKNLDSDELDKISTKNTELDTSSSETFGPFSKKASLVIVLLVSALVAIYFIDSKKQNKC